MTKEEKEYFKFHEGEIISYDKASSSGVIRSESIKVPVKFFLSDFSHLDRFSGIQPLGMKVWFSQLDENKKDMWATVVVERK